MNGTLVRPTARSLGEAHFTNTPHKIQHLRADTLALLLSLANIGAHGRVLVLESCAGLVTGAAAERMGGYGNVRPRLPVMHLWMLEAFARLHILVLFVPELPHNFILQTRTHVACPFS